MVPQLISKLYLFFFVVFAPIFAFFAHMILHLPTPHPKLFFILIVRDVDRMTVRGTSQRQRYEYIKSSIAQGVRYLRKECWRKGREETRPRAARTARSTCMSEACGIHNAWRKRKRTARRRDAGDHGKPMLQVMERGGEGLGPRARDETTKEERPALKRVRKMMVGSRCLFFHGCDVGY